MKPETKQRLISNLPDAKHIEKNESTLIECLTSSSAIDSAEYFQSLIDRGHGDALLKGFGYSEKVIEASKNGGLAAFSLALEEDMKSKFDNDNDQSS